ncbi:MAG: GNAT family protein, partial [Peptococcaceae bacterium]|nr:GNAT family protein [Peptococcaceae bacterium]
WLFRKVEPEQVIGSIALNNIIRGCFHSCHVGYRLDQAMLNQGYMTEGLRAVINTAFTELALHRLEANIIPSNHASMRVVEKLGFYAEGLALKYLCINGRWEDHVHMVLRNSAME